MVDVGAGTPYNYGGLVFEAGDVAERTNWYYGLYTWHSNFNENLFTSAAPTVSDHMAKVIYDAGARDQITLLSHHGYARYLLPFERRWTFDPVRGEWTTTPLAGNVSIAARMARLPPAITIRRGPLSIAT
jgi:hypothetical protein